MRPGKPFAAILAVAILALSNCSKSERAPETGCIASSIGTLHSIPSVPSCTNRLLCQAQCTVGNSEACLGLAYLAQKNSKKEDEAMGMYRRACLLGNANACTNYAATIWATEHTESDLACAQRTFEKACAAKEPFACGMVGRLMIENTHPPSLAEGRKYLEHACDEVGGFPCRVLAYHLEAGRLGSYEPGSIPKLLQRACAGGDPDACGGPATAAATFH
ncbi:MAG: sel1 repeat family protein [Acidobacteria bacterium]|nr:sel1 repeat family protein [Acidobacteriota bacterium]